MHDYPGTPTFPTSISLIDDSDSPNAGNFSPGWEGNRDAALWLRGVQGATAAMNWHATIANISSQSWLAAFLQVQPSDPVHPDSAQFPALWNRWIMTSIDGAGAGKIYYSVDGGKTAVLQATIGAAFTPLPKCLTADATFFIHFGTLSKVFYGSAATVNTSTGSGWNATQGIPYYHTTAGKTFFVGASQSGGTFTGAASSFSVSGPTNTNLSANLPAGWVSGTNHVGEFFAANDGSTYLVAMGGVTPGTDTARLLNAGQLTAPTDITPAACTGKIIAGFAYDPVVGVWILLLNDASNSYVYTSPDHISWTLKKTFTGSILKQIVVIGGAWGFVFPLSDRVPSQTDAALFISADQFATLRVAPVVMSAAGAYYIGGNSTALFFSDAAGIAFSQFVGA